MKRIPSFVLVALFALAPFADAGQPRTHDGFFMRLAGGVAFGNTSLEDNDGDDLEFGDIGSGGNVAIGGNVSRNLALHGTIWSWALNEADGEFNGQGFDSDVNVHFSAIGGGLTYYFGPSNIYLSGSLGLAHIEFDVVDDTDMGMSVTALLGKEWWVGNSWGLGMAANVDFHSLPEGNDPDIDWTGISFGVLFSATLN